MDNSKTYHKIYYEANKEKIKAYAREYGKINRLKKNAQQKIYRENNKKKEVDYYNTNKEKIKAYQQANKEKIKATRKLYNKKNKEKIKATKKKYIELNRERLLIQKREHYATNREQILIRRKVLSNNPENIKHRRAKDRERYNKKYNTNPQFRLSRNMSRVIGRSLKNKKGAHWEELVGYTIENLIKHLEKQFVNGMTWENYGEWHLEHKTPQSVFNYTDPGHRDFKRCWALKNLQPMWAKDNLKKGAKLDKHFQPSLLLKVAVK